MAKQKVSPDSVDVHFVKWHLRLSEILYNASQQQHCVCNMNGTLLGRRINAEFSFCVLIKGLTNLKFFQNMPHSRAILYLIYIGQPSSSDV